MKLHWQNENRKAQKAVLMLNYLIIFKRAQQWSKIKQFDIKILIQKKAIALYSLL
jgi:hypothetical protein